MGMALFVVVVHWLDLGVDDWIRLPRANANGSYFGMDGLEAGGFSPRLDRFATRLLCKC
jgi:hypothetical protein